MKPHKLEDFEINQKYKVVTGNDTFPKGCILMRDIAGYGIQLLGCGMLEPEDIPEGIKGIEIIKL